jgi:hypothetical protein
VLLGYEGSVSLMKLVRCRKHKSKYIDLYMYDSTNKWKMVKFQVLTAASMKMTVFGDVDLVVSCK